MSATEQYTLIIMLSLTVSGVLLIAKGLGLIPIQRETVLAIFYWACVLGTFYYAFAQEMQNRKSGK